MLVQSAAELRAMVSALASHEVTIAGATVPVIFARPMVEPFGMVDAPAPTLTLVAEDWPDVARGDTTPAIDGATYTVIGVQPEGGLVTLRLAA